jgi:hypothetical protein
VAGYFSETRRHPTLSSGKGVGLDDNLPSVYRRAAWKTLEISEIIFEICHKRAKRCFRNSPEKELTKRGHFLKLNGIEKGKSEEILWI